MQVILGDNPFFNVNHRAGVANADSDSSDAEFTLRVALPVLDRATSHSVSSFMLSDYELAPVMMSKFEENFPNRHLDLALVVPYPHAINTMVSEHGYLKAAYKLFGFDIVRFVLRALVAPIFGLRGLFAQVSKSFLTSRIKDYDSVNVKVRWICLHNIMVDLLIAHGRVDALLAFIDSVRALDREAVLLTQNIPALTELIGDRDCVICGSYNILGFMTNPSRDDVVTTISKDRENLSFWAMQLLASGAVSPEEALNDEALAHFDAVLYATTKPDRLTDFLAQLENHAAHQQS